MEWVAYWYEAYFDRLLVLIIAAALYDATWTPSMFLLAVSPGVEWTVIGIIIDFVWATAVVLGLQVWRRGRQSFTATLDLLSCVPWELIGLGTEHGRVFMGLRFLAKVCLSSTVTQPCGLPIPRS